MAKHSKVNVGGDAALAENPVFREQMEKTMNLLVPKDWSREQVTFPPYWQPELAKGFRAIVLARDERDPKFHRYILESQTELDCRTGPVNDGTYVTIQAGEKFSIGCYAALPLERYFGFEVAVICKDQSRLPPNEMSDGRPRDLWNWEMYVSPKTKELLDSRRAEDRALLIEAQRSAGRKALEEIARLNSESRRSVNVALSI